MTSLNDLADVTLTGPIVAGTVLRYNGVQWVNAALNMNDLGDADTATTAPNTGETLIWDGTNWVPGPAGASNNRVFLSDAAVGPATAGAPTVAEITAAAGANRDTILYYTGTNLATDPVTYAYHIDAAGAVTQLDSPASASNPTVFLSDAAVAPATAGAPTIAEITAAAGTNRDVFLHYTGTNVGTDPVTHSYYIDPTGTVTLVEEPNTATCGLREFGGVGGTLAVGVGAGVPNPMQVGYTLAADRIAAIEATPPTGGSDVFEVRLMPGSTVITTGTVAAGQNAATFTPFADVTFTAGQWIEVVVTAVAPTPGAELTVVGELCGPGTPTNVVVTVTEVGEGSVLPADDSQGELFRLIGHATLPDGLYFWNNVSASWVQAG